MKQFCLLALLLCALVATAARAPEGDACSFRDPASQKYLYDSLDIPIFRKSLQGPPSEFGLHVLPTPEELTETSMASTYDFTLTPSAEDANLLSFTALLPVDTTTRMSVNIFSPMESELSIQIVAPSSEGLPICCAADEQVEEEFGIDGASFPTTTYVFNDPQPGLWKLEITAHVSSLELLPTAGGQGPHGSIMLGNLSPYALSTTPLNIQDNVGDQVSVQATLVEAYNPAGSAQAFALDAFTGIKAEIDVVSPDGHVEEYPLHDDGLHSDGEANDGVYGGAFATAEAGFYRGRVVVSGQDPAGNHFERTSDMLFYSVVDTVDVVAASAEYQLLTESLEIQIEVEEKNLDDVAAAPSTYKLYGEVYGTGAGGEEVAIAWIGGMAEVTRVGAKTVLPLLLNLRWIEASGARQDAPFTLRNLRVQDASSSDPVELVAELKIEMEDVLAGVELPVAAEVTMEMRSGPVPAHIAARLAKAGYASDAAADCSNLFGRLLLLNGYCATSNPWPVDEFSNHLVFEGALCSNLDHDEFAQRLVKFAESTGLEACATVGHSQGGPAAAHALNYYWSCLDVGAPCPGRSIQSVGSPYQGTSLAGNLASLGTVFGVGCGSNTDMTIAGAKTWLAGISQATRDEVTYFVTQWKSGLFASCSIPVNLVAQWPNDGTTEVKYSELPGALNGGLKEGWCHTTDMNHPPQYLDATRNADMDSGAVY